MSRTEWIADRLLMTYIAMSKPHPAPIVLATMAEDLDPELTDDQLLRGLSRLRREREWVSVKAILELSGASEEDGRPETEAAWAMCPKSEDASVVWTEEMAEAFGMCRALLIEGDEIGARMVFKEQYPLTVGRARRNHVSVNWTASLGWNVDDRVRALSDAIGRKRIPASYALELLGPEQQDELRLQLPIPERKLLTTQEATENQGKPRLDVNALSGIHKAIAVLIDRKLMPELPPSSPPPKRLNEAQLAERKKQQAQQVRIVMEQAAGRTLSDEEIQQLIADARLRVARQHQESEASQ